MFQFDLGLPSPILASELLSATSLALVPLPMTTTEVSSIEVASSSSWDVIQISSILSNWLPHLSSVTKATGIASTSIVPPSALAS